MKGLKVINAGIYGTPDGFTQGRLFDVKTTTVMNKTMATYAEKYARMKNAIYSAYQATCVPNMTSLKKIARKYGFSATCIDILVNLEAVKRHTVTHNGKDFDCYVWSNRFAYSDLDKLTDIVYRNYYEIMRTKWRQSKKKVKELSKHASIMTLPDAERAITSLQAIHEYEISKRDIRESFDKLAESDFIIGIKRATAELAKEEEFRIVEELKAYDNIIANAIITPDGTYLRSYHRHDCKTHCDSVSGEVYTVDGGTDYIRTSVNSVPAKDAHVYASDPLEKIRDNFVWMTFGKNHEFPEGKYIILRDMSDAHIQAILDTQGHIKGTYVENVFLMEKQYREDNGISVSETFALNEKTKDSIRTNTGITPEDMHEMSPDDISSAIKEHKQTDPLSVFFSNVKRIIKGWITA